MGNTFNFIANDKNPVGFIDAIVRIGFPVADVFQCFVTEENNVPGIIANPEFRVDINLIAKIAFEYNIMAIKAMMYIDVPVAFIRRL
ncbi:MAG: hypothetical protein HC898_13360 [Phycisphaerales bacterium]|nr:hypothetical protein [Phycisphaerales bacterium]